MGELKGQFLLISSIIIGLMIISASATITTSQSERFDPDPEPYYVNTIKHEAGKVDMASTEERENFGNMVDLLPSYRTSTTAWDSDNDGSYNCFNVTLEKAGESLHFAAPDPCP